MSENNKKNKMPATKHSKIIRVGFILAFFLSLAILSLQSSENGTFRGTGFLFSTNTQIEFQEPIIDIKQFRLATRNRILTKHAAAATSINLIASADNQITGTSGSDQTWNRGGFSTFAAGQSNQSGDLQRSLIKFDLSSIPAGSTISSASLQLTCVGQFASTSYMVSAYRVLRAWSEGTSAVGSYNLNTNSSWTYANYPATWGTPGADNTASDRGSSPIGSQSFSGCTNTSVSVTLDPSVVSSWVDSPATNFGLILIGNESTLQTTKNFASREDPNAAYRPTLTIVYTSSNPSPIVCGNGVVEGTEQCDSLNLAGASCTTQGFTGGSLSCNGSCQFNTVACTQSSGPVCGNGVIESGEQCEGSNLNGASCVTLGYAGGSVSCSGTCQYVTAACTTPPTTSGTFHVRTDGSDTSCNGSANAGSASAPNCSFKTIQKAVNSLTGAGNRIIIHAGTYPEYVQIGPGQPNGTAQNPIMIEGDPNVPRSSIIVDGSAFDGTFLVNGTSGGTTKVYYVFQHFSFKTGRTQGMELGNFNNGYAANMVARDLEVHSINFVQSTPYNSRVITASTWTGGPYGNSGNMLIENVVIDNAENGSQVASGVGIFATSGNTVIRKTNIKDVKALGRVGNATTLEFNTWEFSNCDSDGGCIQLYNGYALLMRYNTIRVKNNIVAQGRVMETRCCAAGTSAAGSPDFASAFIYNNVFDYQGTTEATAITLDHGTQYASIRNNIFKGFKTTAGSSGAWTVIGTNCSKYEFKYNALYNSNLTRASSGCGTVLDPTNLANTATIDFNTVSYVPNAGSRLINVGDPILSIPISGGTRSDIGAYESSAGTTLPYDFQIRDTSSSNLPTLDWGNSSTSNINIASPFGFAVQAGYQCQIDSATTFDSQGRGKPLYDSGAPNSSAATSCQSTTSLSNGNYYARVRFRNEDPGISSYTGIWSDHYYKFSIGSTSAPVCNNGIVESGEQCDGSNLNGASCTSQGFSGGTLTCSSSCQLVTTQCTASSFSTYHVRTDGSDTGCNGSANTSAASAPNCAFRTIQKAIDTMTAGKTVLVHAGTYTDLGATVTSRRVLAYVNAKSGGSSTQRYTIKAAPGETVILDGATNALWVAFMVNNSPYVTIEGFQMRNFTGGTSQDGVIYFLGSSTDGEILNNSISNTAPAGIHDISIVNVVRAKISGNTITTSLGVPIEYSGPTTAAAVTDGEISDNKILISSGTTANIRGLIIVKASGNKILKNFIQLTGTAKDADTGIYLRDHSDSVLQGNVIVGFSDAVAYQDESFSGTSTPINEEERLILSNNVFDGAGAPISVGFSANWGGYKSCDGCKIYNNIIMNVGSGIVLFGDPAAFPSSTTIAKNIRYNAGADVISTSDVTQGTNLTATIAPIKATGSKPTTYYELATGSQAINFGDNTYCGITNSDGQCDAGAYEFISSSTSCGNTPAAGTPDGYGAATTGGGSNPIVCVTNLNDSGAGSLRDALSGSNRRIYFSVGGIINLTTRLNLLNQQNVTIDGSTAPAPGITLRGQQFEIKDSNNVIVRHIRSRDIGNTVSNTPGIAVWCPTVACSKFWIDHVSVSRASDDSILVYGGPRDVTISNSIIYDAYDPIDPSPEGMSISGANGLYADRVTVHHTVITSNFERNPSLSGDPISSGGMTTVDFRNNIVHKWGQGGYGTRVRWNVKANIVNNVYYSVNSLTQAVIFESPFNNTYINGNYEQSGATINALSTASTPYATPAITEHTVAQLRQALGGNPILDSAGAYPRDSVDTIAIAAVAADIVAPAADTTPPVRTNGQPSGTLPTNTAQTIMSLSTDENATCKYSTAANTAYNSMTQIFSTTGTTVHSITLTGLVNNTTYTYYVKCRDNATTPNANTTEYTISFSVAADTTPPVRSNALPSGTLPAGTSQTIMSLTTDENATCKYGTQQGIAYASLPNTFTTTGGTTHTLTLSTLANGTSYAYYVRCRDAVNNLNTTDYPVSFSVAQTPVGTLSVSLNAVPTTGNSPLTSSLTATVTGTEPGTIDYTFYCNRADSGTNITTPFSAQAQAQVGTSYTASNVCNFATTGTYTAKVIVQRGSAANAEARAIITVNAAQIADTTPPIVLISTPQAQASLTGSTLISANASDNIGVTSVLFKIDGTAVGAEITQAPYELIWDTRTWTNDSHIITAIASDAAGNLTTSSGVTVIVNNAAASQCIELWTCSSWTSCVNGTQTRTCSELNNCGTTVQRPALNQSCAAPISGGGGGSSTTNPNATSTPTGNTNATNTNNATGNTTLTQSAIDAFIALQKKLVTRIDLALVNRLLGRILLQVQSHGEAWYLDVVSKVRYYLADGNRAYAALRKFGLGITDANINKIPVGIEARFQEVDTDGDGLSDKMEEGLGTNPTNPDTDGDGFADGAEIRSNYSPLGTTKLPIDLTLTNRLKGRILIQVQKKGQAWYVNPADGKRYYMTDGNAAYQIMRFLSLGITNIDIQKIGIGTL